MNFASLLPKINFKNVCAFLWHVFSKDIVKEKFHLKNSLTKSDFKNTSGSK